MEDDDYVTHLIGLAAYLIAAGINLHEAFWGQAPTGRRMCFWRFDKSDELELRLSEYEAAQARVEPKRYEEIMDELKRGMYQAPGVPERLRRG